MSSNESSMYLVHFRDPETGEIAHVKAKSVSDSSLGLSFVTLSDFVFVTSRLIANPKEEQMRDRFKDVKALHLSIYNIISVEEIGADHKALKFKNDRSSLVVLDRPGLFPNN